MQRRRFTYEEIVLCTYIALYDGYEFGGARSIHYLTGRSFSSIEMKIRNIVAALDEDGINHSANISPNKGTPASQLARRTDWHTIAHLVSLPRPQLLLECKGFL